VESGDYQFKIGSRSQRVESSSSSRVNKHGKTKMKRAQFREPPRSSEEVSEEKEDDGEPLLHSISIEVPRPALKSPAKNMATLNQATSDLNQVIGGGSKRQT
jgi:hypothetical protein